MKECSGRETGINRYPEVGEAGCSSCGPLVQAVLSVRALDFTL